MLRPARALRELGRSERVLVRRRTDRQPGARVAPGLIRITSTRTASHRDNHVPQTDNLSRSIGCQLD